MKSAKPIQEDWLMQHSAESIAQTVCRVDKPASCLSMAAEDADTDVYRRRVASRQHLQQQLGKPKSFTDQAAIQGTLWGNSERTGQFARSTDERGRIATHLNSAMELAESLQGRSVKRSYRERKTTGVLICRHLVAALKLEDEESGHSDHAR